MKTETVFIGYQNCKVYDDFNINRCQICCGYNHSHTKCKDKGTLQSCSKCSENHEVTTCKSEVKKCINCINANKYLTKKRPIDHSADDINKCETYKIRWEQHVNGTNYPWKPKLPFKNTDPGS